MAQTFNPSTQEAVRGSLPTFYEKFASTFQRKPVEPQHLAKGPMHGDSIPVGDGISGQFRVHPELYKNSAFWGGAASVL